jgi:nicotinate-nucleotide adenylyltransferase
MAAVSPRIAAYAGPAPLAAASGRHGALRPGFHLERGMRVGLFGGSFNPAHAGHAHVAETAMIRLGLDRVIWLVSPQNPLKSAGETAPLAERVRSAADQARGAAMIVSDFETRIRATYTVDTVCALKVRFPGVRFVWVMGADNLVGFHRWRGWIQIASLLPIAVVARPGSLLESRSALAARRLAAFRLPSRQAARLAEMDPPAWVYIEAPLNSLSSTELRRARSGADKPLTAS